MKRPGQESVTQRIVEVFVRGNLSVMLILISLLAGAVALLVTPREEEPQIVVPLADVYVQVPGASAEEVERQVATRLEKLLYQIDGVEYVYSISKPGLAVVTVRFYVGENRENSLVKIYNKIQSNIDQVPVSVASWVVKPIEIDDVPILNITLYSDRYDDAELRRLAEEIEIKLQSVKNTNRTFVIGGRPRRVPVELDSTRLALDGMAVGSLRVANEVNPLMIEIRLPRESRSGAEELRRLYLKGLTGNLVPLAEIGYFEERIEDKTVYHKNLERVVYVFAEMAGRAPAEAILDIQADRISDSPVKSKDAMESGVRPVEKRSYFQMGARLPWHVGDEFKIAWAGEGEWKITVDVFRDLGIAFAAACLGIYVLLVYQTGSYFMPLILMISIPLTMIGIMPGFWLLNLISNRPVGGFENPVFFTATAMIGMIALSGLAVRNAILLIEFVHEALRRGDDLFTALLHSGAVRFRPIVLTAGAAMLGAWPITLDPIFSGLAWALIFGLTVSTAFTLLLIPVIYWMVYANHPGHGLALEGEEEA